MRRYLALLLLVVGSTSLAAESTLYDASLYAGAKFCTALIAKTCVMPKDLPAPSFKTEAECIAQGKVGADAGASLTKTKKPKNYKKCKKAIDKLAAAKDGDCMAIAMAHMSAPECQ